MAKKKLSELKQVDGKLQEPKKKITAQTLEAIWGNDSGLAKYKTLDVEEYKSQLNEMNSADIRIHATKLGFMPIENTERLKNKLITEFTRHVSSYNRPEPVGANGKKVSKEVLNILAEAK